MAEIWTMGEMLCEIMRPEPDCPLSEPGWFRGPFPSGAPAIMIDTVARLGHSAGIVSGVGRDDFGTCMLERLTKDGVDVSNVVRCERGSTGVAFVTYFRDGSRKFIYHFSDTPATAAKAPDASIFRDARFLHIMGCSLMASASFGREIVKAMHDAIRSGAKVSFDPNIRKELLSDEQGLSLVSSVMQECSVFMPGVSELLMISGCENVEEAVSACFENAKLEIIALKNGSKGSVVYTRSGSASFGIYPADVLDTTGAGDCFDGAFLCGLLEGRSIEETAKLATAAATLNTAAFGPMEGNISRKAVFAKMQEGLSA